METEVALDTDTGSGYFYHSKVRPLLCHKDFSLEPLSALGTKWGILGFLGVASSPHICFRGALLSAVLGQTESDTYKTNQTPRTIYKFLFAFFCSDGTRTQGLGQARQVFQP